MFLLQSPFYEVATSNFRNDYSNNEKLRDKIISVHVTLSNDSCNLCRNEIAKKIARKNAWSNSALKLGNATGILTFLVKMVHDNIFP